MTFFKTAVATAALVVIGAGAQAASWDFALDADVFANANEYEGTFAQVYGASASGGDISVSASASMHPDYEVDSIVHPFMDSDGNFGASNPSNYAGLGVCSSGFDHGSLSISDCSTGDGNATGDDNLVFPEILELVFSDSVRLRELFVRDADHDPLNGMIVITVGEHDGDVFDVVDGYVQGVAGAGFSSSFFFTSYPEAEGSGEIYLSTLTATIPVPAAGFLLLGGLGGLAAMRRRKS